MRVILAAGGSGGHIFPSLALEAEIQKKGDHDVFFVSSMRRLDRTLLDKNEKEAFFLSVNPMPRKFNPVKIFTFICNLIKDVFRSFAILLKVKPHVVVGFGGYSSGAICMSARILNVPVLIHEQNLYPGRANKILKFFVNKIAVSFKDSFSFFKHYRHKLIYSGNPIRLGSLNNEPRASAVRLDLDSDKLTVLIMGGSQGSSFLNKSLSKVAKLIKEQKGETIQFIHLTGKKDFKDIECFYKNNMISGRVFPFLDRIDDAYALCDIAVTRAGASAIFELAYYGKPMILIPYPNPKNNQRFNAVYFSEQGAAINEREKGLEAETLFREIMEILEGKEKYCEMAENAARLGFPDAGKVLAEEVLALGAKRR